MTLEQDIKEWLERRLSDDPEILDKYDPNTLTFSYIMGMHPSECTGMEVEADWTASQIRDWDEANGIISRLKRKSNSYY